MLTVTSPLWMPLIAGFAVWAALRRLGRAAANDDAPPVPVRVSVAPDR